ncbi:MAG TPA: XRE family transcriptional regulator [Hypericibacter adhaerens]|jgi:transcriptional regulator with XRE-family HTH domain|uniref:helix-turn-helix domain-containing protein n=1 Tax=Hypericibacter adhaerens TaxID=2602016 RepID=UPI002B88B957|nr:XRE family transcriptional regulator [Hypericibacter adhaerens]HWA42729.1 XRE family transcriptional regulator [Hypericibacter adhaerens]
MDLTTAEIGERIKALRKERRWTLQALGKRSGVSISALSKVENAQVAASFDTLLRIARGFGLGFEAMLNGTPSLPAGRLTTTRGGAGVFFSTDMYEYEVHSAELRQKHMIPLHMEVKARRLGDISRWSTHEGEEFIYVLQGDIELHTELYAPVRLKEGDSAYIDSKMRHAFLNRGKGRAWMLSICFSQDMKLPGRQSASRKFPAGRAARPAARRPAAGRG